MAGIRRPIPFSYVLPLNCYLYMRRLRYLTPAIAFMLLTLSCKDKTKPAGFLTGEPQEEVEYPIDADSSDRVEVRSIDADNTGMESSGTADSHSAIANPSEGPNEPKFKGVESDLRDFSDAPESAKKEALMEIAKLQEQLQAIAFNGKSDFKKAEGLSRNISSLFASIGAKEESKRWLQTADAYHKQAK